MSKKKGLWKSERRITFKTLRSGQPRPYADEELLGHVFAEWHPLGKDVDVESWAPNNLDDKRIRKLAKAFWGWNDEPTTPFDTQLVSFKRIGDGLWEVRTRAAYTG